MSYEVHITRGEAFADPGGDPITLDQWRRVVAEAASFAGADTALHGPDSAMLGGTLLQWSDGIVSARSPRNLDALASLSAALGARMFGEDGSELGLGARDEVLRTLERGFPKVAASSLSRAACQDLVRVGDPLVPAAERRSALGAIVGLLGDAGRASLAYLACRAVECSGDPVEEVTEASAALLHLDPALLDGLRAPPTEAWVIAVHQRAKRAREPRVVTCSCGQQNRVPASVPPGKRPRCGQCKSPLPV